MGEKTEVVGPLRVVLDTNVAVSALVFREGRLAWLREAWEAGRVIPVVSAETIAELVRVLAYPKLKLAEDDTKNLLAHYMEFAQPVRKIKSSARIPECCDPDDRIFLRLAYTARAQALVMGDADLLSVADKSPIPIMTPAGLKMKLGV